MQQPKRDLLMSMVWVVVLHPKGEFVERTCTSLNTRLQHVWFRRVAAALASGATSRYTFPARSPHEHHTTQAAGSCLAPPLPVQRISRSTPNCRNRQAWRALQWLDQDCD